MLNSVSKNKCATAMHRALPSTGNPNINFSNVTTSSPRQYLSNFFNKVSKMFSWKIAPEQATYVGAKSVPVVDTTNTIINLTNSVFTTGLKMCTKVHDFTPIVVEKILGGTNIASPLLKLYELLSHCKKLHCFLRDYSPTNSSSSENKVENSFYSKKIRDFGAELFRDAADLTRFALPAVQDGLKFAGVTAPAVFGFVVPGVSTLLSGVFLGKYIRDWFRGQKLLKQEKEIFKAEKSVSGEISKIRFLQRIKDVQIDTLTQKVKSKRSMTAVYACFTAIGALGFGFAFAAGSLATAGTIPALVVSCGLIYMGVSSTVQVIQKYRANKSLQKEEAALTKEINKTEAEINKLIDDTQELEDNKLNAGNDVEVKKFEKWISINESKCRAKIAKLEKSCEAVQTRRWKLRPEEAAKELLAQLFPGNGTYNEALKEHLQKCFDLKPRRVWIWSEKQTFDKFFNELEIKYRLCNQKNDSHLEGRLIRMVGIALNMID